MSYGAKLIVNTSQLAGIYTRGTNYGIYGAVSGATLGAAAVYGEAGLGQYGVYGKSSADAPGEYIGVYGLGTQGDTGAPGTVYIGGKFYGDNGTGAGYSVQLQDGTEGVGKVLVSQTSDGKANWNTFSGINITITSAATNTIVFSAATGGGGGGGAVSSVTAGSGLSGNSTTGAIEIINTDKGSSQNIFKNIQVNGATQFSAGSNSSNLNFSGINITITSAATNTLVFSAATGGGGGGVTQIIAGTNITISPTGGTGVVTINSTGSGGTGAVSSVTAGTGLTGNSTTGAVTLQLSNPSYTIYANNTALTAVPTATTYKETGEADFSATSTITWGSAPSTAGNYRYRWQQIGNMVVFAFEWTSSALGTLPLTITLPTDMPSPAIPTGFNAANYVIHRYFCTFNNAIGGGGATTTASFMVLRRNAANNGWEFNNPLTNTVRWFSFTGNYFA